MRDEIIRAITFALLQFCGGMLGGAMAQLHYLYGKKRKPVYKAQLSSCDYKVESTILITDALNAEDAWDTAFDECKEQEKRYYNLVQWCVRDLIKIE